MRAWQHAERGLPADVLRIKDNVPIPVEKEDEILVKVYCASLTAGSAKGIKIFPSWLLKRPAIPELEASGVVERVGKNVQKFKAGDEVFGFVDVDLILKGVGVLAEYVSLRERDSVLKPRNVSWQEACGASTTALTAYEALLFKGNMKPGMRVFINGGSGGVGHYAVQLAKILGASFVVSCCSAPNIDFVTSLGADEVFNYREVDVPTYLAQTYGNKPFDVIFDTVGIQEIFNGCEKYLKPDGKFVSCGAEMDGLGGFLKMGINMVSNLYLPRIFGGVPRSYTFFSLRVTPEKFEAVRALLEEGKLKTTLHSTHSFANALDAYAIIVSGRARGKVVVNVIEN